MPLTKEVAHIVKYAIINMTSLITIYCYNKLAFSSCYLSISSLTAKNLCFVDYIVIVNKIVPLSRRAFIKTDKMT